MEETTIEQPTPARHEAPRLWYAMLVRGLLAFVIGAYALAQPAMTMNMLAVVLGAYALVDAALAFETARRAHRLRERTWPLAVEGMLGCVAAVAAWAFPVVVAIQIVSGVRALLCGALEATWAMRPYAGEARWMIGFGGAATVFFGILLLAWPGPAAVALGWLIGLQMMASGGMLVGGSLAERAADQAHVVHGARELA